MSVEKCVDCEAAIQALENTVNGEIVTCPECGLDLEVSVTPTRPLSQIFGYRERGSAREHS